MTEKDFVYWLQGFFEISQEEKLSKKQVQIIRDHLELVLKKETPNRTLEDLKFPDLAKPSTILTC